MRAQDLPYVGAFVLGLVLAVRAMINGVERPTREGRIRFTLNGVTIAAFATVFGATGYPLAAYSSLSPTVVALIAVAVGLVGVALALTLVAGWAIPAARAEVVDERYVLQGSVARVTSVTADHTAGTIAFDAGGVHQTASARGLDGVRLELGTEVAIERIEDGIAYVEPWSQVESRL
jgi:hypothetical protein